MTAKHGDLITDGSVTWRVVDRRIHGKIADIPNYYQRSALMSNSGNTLVMPSMQVNINNQGFVGESQSINLDTQDNWDSQSVGFGIQKNRAGRDFYVYALANTTGNLQFILSTNSTVPTGYTATDSRKIGGFHCLCVDVGTISGHKLSGLKAGAIIPNSIWDLRHRPLSDPEGMVWVEGLGLWVDIYLNSWSSTESRLVSTYGGTIADATSTPAFHGEIFTEKLGLIGKRLPSREEFSVFANGIVPKYRLSTSADPVTTGGHKNTNSNRIISNYGIEDCCGVMWQWTKTMTFAEDSGYHRTSVYHSDIDTEVYGYACDLSVRRLIVGGYFKNTETHIGIRACDSFYSAPVSGDSNEDISDAANISARGVSPKRNIEY